MAFTVQEYLDLVRLLAEHPEWRSELRRLLLSDDLLALPEIVRELAEAQQRTEERLERLEIIVGTLIEQVSTLVEAQRRTDEQLQALTQAQRRTEDHLERLESTTKTLADTVGDLKGRSLEITYRDKAMAYFGPLLRQLHVVALQTLEETLEAHLSSEELNEVLLLDLLVSGQPRHHSDMPEVWLAVEISAVVDQGDLDRARRRAALLCQAGYQAIPVVAGERITLGAEDEARLHKVAVLQDGRVFLWEEALQTWAAR